MNTKNVSALVAAALLAGCAAAPAPQSAPVATAVPPAPANLTQVYFYAQRGQSQAQQDRDRYECFNWAVQQTGFDPSRRAVPAEHRQPLVPVRTTPAPPWWAAALMGAAIGAASREPWQRGEGAVDRCHRRHGPGCAGGHLASVRTPVPLRPRRSRCHLRAAVMNSRRRNIAAPCPRASKAAVTL